MKEAILSSEASVLTIATRRSIPEDGILHGAFETENRLFVEEWCFLGCYAVWLL
jgi:hypothetical protein